MLVGAGHSQKCAWAKVGFAEELGQRALVCGWLSLCVALVVWCFFLESSRPEAKVGHESFWVSF